MSFQPFILLAILQRQYLWKRSTGISLGYTFQKLCFYAVNNLVDRLLQNWGLFFSEEHKFLIFVPPKCGSTSIFTALVRAMSPEASYLNLESPECLPELKIHTYVRQNYLPGKDQLMKALFDSNFKKILVVRHPFKRFVGAITSKYMLPNSPFSKELFGEFAPQLTCLRTSYDNHKQVLDSVEQIANRLLLLKPAIDRDGSHIKPLDYIFIQKELLVFNHIIDVSHDRPGYQCLLSTINSFIKSPDVFINDIPHLNESPLSLRFSMFSQQTRQRIALFYSKELELFDYPSFDELEDSSISSELTWEQIFAANLYYGAVSVFFGSQAINEKRRNELSQCIDANTQALHKVEGERDALLKEKGEVQQWASNLKGQLEAKVEEFSKLERERDARDKELEKAQKWAMGLKEKLQIKESELQDVIDVRDARDKELEKAQKRAMGLKEELQIKNTELQKVVGERDARANEKEEAQQASEELSKQLEIKDSELQKVIVERDVQRQENLVIKSSSSEFKREIESKDLLLHNLSAELQQLKMDYNMQIEAQAKSKDKYNELSLLFNDVSEKLVVQNNERIAAQHEAQQTLAQLHIVQDELVNSAKDQKILISERDSLLSSTSELKQLVTDLQKQLHASQIEFQEALNERDAIEEERNLAKKYHHEIKTSLSSLEENYQLNLLQLHQVQEELESVRLNSDKLLNDKNCIQLQFNDLSLDFKKSEDNANSILSQMKCLKEELHVLSIVNDQLRTDSATQTDNLNSQITDAGQQISLVTEESDLLRDQLYQVQNELKHYFKITQQQSKMLDSYASLVQRFAILFSASISSSFVEGAPRVKMLGVSVEHTIVNRTLSADHA